jgi:hypothetical protein
MAMKPSCYDPVRRAQGCISVLLAAFAIAVAILAHPVASASEGREEHLQKAIDELLASNPLSAVREAEQAVEANPRSAEALAILGMARLKCGEWEKAESRFNAAIAIDSLLPEAHLGLGILSVSIMHSRDAIPHLRQATTSKLFPGAAYCALAASMEELNQHQQASQAMREASKYKDDIPPDQLANLPNLADIYAAYDGRTLYRIPDDFQSTSVPLDRSEWGHITLPAALNGSEIEKLVFDTGLSGALMISDDYAEGLNLSYIAGITTTISVAGHLDLKAAVLDSLRIGGLLMYDVPVFVCVNCPFGSIAVIGWPVIKRVNTTIDFETMEIHISRQDNPGVHWEEISAKDRTECVPFAYLTSMFVMACFDDSLPRAYVFDTGSPTGVLHRSDSDTPEGTQSDSRHFVRFGKLFYDAPKTEFMDFSAIHKRGRYYFPGVIGIDILRHSVLHIFPSESILCIEKG